MMADFPYASMCFPSPLLGWMSTTAHFEESGFDPQLYIILPPWNVRTHEAQYGFQSCNHWCSHFLWIPTNVMIECVCIRWIFLPVNKLPRNRMVVSLIIPQETRTQFSIVCCLSASSPKKNASYHFSGVSIFWQEWDHLLIHIIYTVYIYTWYIYTHIRMIYIYMCVCTYVSYIYDIYIYDIYIWYIYISYIIYHTSYIIYHTSCIWYVYICYINIYIYCII
jgi:hypothetical protein